ncbi:MAG TPA: hypothetical protein VLA49_07750 [Anaerolineales bacterium]|nr:hypothetical protein [Anaerolineales bacterium]
MANDTQWPRFQVFVQEKHGSPFLDYGSVHAPDPEMALLNARDVFARRPECVAMWVVPAQGIFSKTAQELADWQSMPSPHNVSTPEPYHVFAKSKSVGTQTQIGQVEASSPEGALLLALDRFRKTTTAFAWWVFPAQLVLSSQVQDIPSLYAPAGEKTFRLSTDYKTVTAMRQLLGKSSEE